MSFQPIENPMEEQETVRGTNNFAKHQDEEDQAGHIKKGRSPVASFHSAGSSQKTLTQTE
jgi:hypothetical protein